MGAFLIGAVGLGGILLAKAIFGGGRRTWPIVPNRGVLSPFKALRTTSGTRYHAGVDLRAQPGDKVVALADGEVLSLVTGYDIGAGLQAVTVRHLDADYIYAEIDVVSELEHYLKGGRTVRVKAGDVLGVVRKNKDGNQMLHLEAWKTGRAPTAFTPWYVGRPPPDGLLNAEVLIAPLADTGIKGDPR